MLTASRLVLLIGVILCVLGSFGISVGPAQLFQLGVATCFASFLVP